MQITEDRDGETLSIERIGMGFRGSLGNAPSVSGSLDNVLGELFENSELSDPHRRLLDMHVSVEDVLADIRHAVERIPYFANFGVDPSS